jgi:hypothetical protein
MQFIANVFGFARTVQYTANMASLRLFVAASTMFVVLVNAPSVWAAKGDRQGDNFDAPVRWEWAKNFDGLFDYLNGNFRGLTIGVSLVLLPFIILMIIISGRNKDKSTGWMRWGALVAGCVMLALWLPTIGEAIIVTPEEAKASAK